MPFKRADNYISPNAYSTSGAVPGTMKGNININPQQLDAVRAQVGEFLKKKRQEKGWSQTELADKMWVRPATVSQVEAGKWAITIDMLALFCHHMGIDLKKLFK